jgi:hypothetical protein
VRDKILARHTGLFRQQGYKFDHVICSSVGN